MCMYVYTYACLIYTSSWAPFSSFEERYNDTRPLWYVCVCLYILTHIHTHTYESTWCTLVLRRLSARFKRDPMIPGPCDVFVCVYKCLYVQMYVCMYACRSASCAWGFRGFWARLREFRACDVYIYVHTCTHNITYTYTHIHTYAYMHRYS